MSEVVLLVNGERYGGWKTVRVRLGIEQIAGSFELSVSEMWPDQAAEIVIKPFDACKLQIDGETLITGFVDELGVDYDAEQHTVTVRGRDATGDLVDCSAIHASGEWKNQNALQIARDLCAPFDIKVKATVDVGEPFSTWSIQEGETVFENIDRMCRHRALLPISDGVGGMVLTRAGTERAPTALVLGENIKNASGTKSGLDRYSQYIVKGQRPVDDLVEGDDATALRGYTEDEAVPRYRPLIIVDSTASDQASLQKRAEWERNVRAGRAAPMTYTAQGWRHRDGLWRSNTIVPVRDSFLRTERDYLVKSLQYRLDDNGEQVDLDITLPEAFDLVALPEPDDESLSP